MTAERFKTRSAVRHGDGAAQSAPSRARRARARRKAQLTAWGFILPVVAYLGIFYAYPLYRNIDLSLRSYTLSSFITGDAPFAGLSNYINVIHNPTFAPALINTAIFTVVSIAFQFAIGLALAVFFFKTFRLSGILRALFLVPWLLPLLVSASTWSWMLNSDSGIVNSFLQAVGMQPVDWLTSPKWALVAVLIANIWIGIPFNLVIMYSGLQSISPDIFEAAVDRRRQRLAAVLADHLPAAAPGVRHHPAARPRLHAEGVRHHLDHDQRRSGHRVDHARDLVLSARLRVAAARLQLRRDRRQRADPHRGGLRARVHPGQEQIGDDMKRRSWWLTAIGVLVTAVMLFPVYWMINVSLTSTPDMRKSPPNLIPIDGTLQGYSVVLHQQLPYLGTSLLIGLGTVAVTLVLAAPAGYSLAKLHPRGGGVLSFVLLIAQMIPAIVMAMGFYVIYLKLGLLNTVWGLIIADSTIAVPFGVLIFTAFMSRIPNELLQAARIDGAGAMRTFLSIVVPVSRNAVVTVSLFAFLWAWSDFLFANTLDSGGGHQPITLGIYAYIGNNNQQWNAIMATAVVASIPAAVLLVLAQRYVAAGVTSGAVKD